MSMMTNQDLKIYALMIIQNLFILKLDSMIKTINLNGALMVLATLPILQLWVKQVLEKQEF